MLQNYVKYLKNNKVNPSTIINHLWGVEKFFMYLQIYHPNNISNTIFPLILRIKKGLRKQRKKIIKDINVFINSKSWPKNGIKELHDIVHRYIYNPFFSLIILFSFRIEPSIIKLCERAQQGNIFSKRDYKSFLDFLISHFYVANPQARICAMDKLQLNHMHQLKDCGKVAMEDFKTCETYKYQIIMACPATYR